MQAMLPSRNIHCVFIAVAFTVAWPYPSTANDDAVKGSQSDYVQQIATRLKPLQRNGWFEWTPGTVLVTTFLPADPQKFTSYVQADLTYTFGEKDRPLTRTQFFGGESHVQELHLGRPEDGPIPVARLYEPSSGEAVQLSLDGTEVKCLLFTHRMRADLGGGWGESVQKKWVVASEPTICIGWQLKEGTYGFVNSIGTTRNVGGNKYRCVVIEQRRAMVNDGFSIETKYLSPQVPGFVVERITTIHRSATDMKPVRIREQVKRVVVPQ